MKVVCTKNILKCNQNIHLEGYAFHLGECSAGVTHHLACDVIAVMGGADFLRKQAQHCFGKHRLKAKLSAQIAF